MKSYPSRKYLTRRRPRISAPSLAGYWTPVAFWSPYMMKNSLHGDIPSVLCYVHEVAKSSQKIIGQMKHNNHVGQPADECLQIVLGGITAVRNFNDGLPPCNEFFIG